MIALSSAIDEQESSDFSIASLCVFTYQRDDVLASCIRASDDINIVRQLVSKNDIAIVFKPEVPVTDPSEN
jgi:hypothetical protein